MTIDNNHLIASEGQVLRRLSDGLVVGNEIYLGYTYRINNELLNVPLLEVPDHYEEIDDIETEEEVLLEEGFDMIEEILPVSLELSDDQHYIPEPIEPRRITVSDYRKLERQVEAIIKMMGLEENIF